MTHAFTSQKLFDVIVDVYAGAPTSQGKPLIAEGKGVADLGGAKLIVPAGPFKIDTGINFAFSIAFCAGHHLPLGVQQRALQPALPREGQGRQHPHLQPHRDGELHAAGDRRRSFRYGDRPDSTAFNVTSTYPWPTFEVTSLNMGAPTGNIQQNTSSPPGSTSPSTPRSSTASSARKFGCTSSMCRRTPSW